MKGIFTILLVALGLCSVVATLRAGEAKEYQSKLQACLDREATEEKTWGLQLEKEELSSLVCADRIPMAYEAGWRRFSVTRGQWTLSAYFKNATQDQAEKYLDSLYPSGRSSETSDAEGSR